MKLLAIIALAGSTLACAGVAVAADDRNNGTANEAASALSQQSGPTHQEWSIVFETIQRNKDAGKKRK